MPIPQKPLGSTSSKHRSLPPLPHPNLPNASEWDLIADGRHGDKDPSGGSKNRSRSIQPPTEGNYRQTEGTPYEDTVTSQDGNDHLDNRDQQVVRDEKYRGQLQACQGSTTSLQLEGTRRDLSVPGRPSRFQEGSMNDRVSKKPPAEFMREDEDMEGYSLDGLRNKSLDSASIKPSLSSGRAAPSSNSAVLTTESRADKEPARRSGIFRFGKSLAAAFNPAHIWDDLTNKRKRGPDGPQAQNDVLEERRARAERTYQEMKKNGQLAALATPAHTRNRDSSSGVYSQGMKRHPPNQDCESGGPSKSGRLSAEYRHENLSFGDEDHLLPPPPIRDPADVGTPTVDTKSGRRSSLHFKRPSIPSLKKARSEWQLDTSKDRTALRSLQQAPADDPSTGNAPRSLHKPKSKKDLQKERRLSKKVSDLESQLQAVRRQLHEVRGETTPHHPSQEHDYRRKAFVPGALASLPSERMLFPMGHGAEEAAAEASKATSSAKREGCDKGTEDTRNKNTNSDGAIGLPSRVHKKKSGYYAKVERGLTPRKRKSTSWIKDDSRNELRSGQHGDAKENKTSTKDLRRAKKLQKMDELDTTGQTDIAAETCEPDDTHNNNTNRPLEPPFLSTPKSVSPIRMVKVSSGSTPPPTSKHPSLAGDTATSATPEQDTVPPLPKIPMHGFDRVARFTTSTTEVTSLQPIKRGPSAVGFTGRQNDSFEWPDDVF